MDDEDKLKIENDLLKFKKQLSIQIGYQEEYQSLIEELTSQREVNPDDVELKDELLKVYKIIAKKDEEIQYLIEKIKTLEWLLE